ncbi:C40 family peptidase [Nocardioides jensenii]|uniref:C40 family peptidase n=1 Tax=Nocardioides jensenii TaxID=1843 RepID=UPI0009EA985C|nr:C40 family peptidase [Nocardioides jensenii]
MKQYGRKRILAGLTSTIAIIGISTLPAAPSNAEPDIDDVKARVDTLYHQAEQASERYNDAKLKLDDLEADLSALKADEKKQQAKVDSMTSAVSDAVAAQYEGQDISTTGQLVLSNSPDEFLDDLNTLSAYNDVQADTVGDYTRESDALEIRREATEERADELADTKADLESNKDEADDKLAEAKKLLDKLEAEERARFEEEASRGSTTRLPSNVPVSGRAAAAVNYALGQVGDAYVYGAAGPSAFDCSGLTMMAWAQAGVGLPHSSSAQMGSGTSVSSSDLKPGDLVFYYSPVSHVGMYIGGGQIVHAANPGSGVTIAGVFSMPFSGAVRPG